MHTWLPDNKNFLPKQRATLIEQTGRMERNFGVTFAIAPSRGLGGAVHGAFFLAHGDFFSTVPTVSRPVLPSDSLTLPQADIKSGALVISARPVRPSEHLIGRLTVGRLSFRS